MIRSQTEDLTKGWPLDAYPGWSPDLVQKYCVQDQEWQGVRLSMKGQLTSKKLDILYHYLARKVGSEYINIRRSKDERFWCQVDNYLGALRRGGQLDADNMIRKVI